MVSKLNFMMFWMTLWALVRVVFLPQNLKLTESSFKSCMMFRTLNYIHSCNFLVDFLLGHVDFDQWTIKVLPRMILIFGRMNEMVFNYEKGVP